MQKGETIKGMYTRFGEIVNPMKNLGVKLKEEQLVRKILRSLTSDWSPKSIAIQEVKDLSTLPLDDLVDSLMAYEVQLENIKRNEEEKILSKKKNIAFIDLEFEMRNQRIQKGLLYGASGDHFFPGIFFENLGGGKYDYKIDSKTELLTN